MKKPRLSPGFSFYSERGVALATAEATAAAAAEATAAAAAAEAAGARTIFLGLGFVDHELAAFEVLIVQGFDRLGAGFGSGEGHEAETTATAGFAVHHDDGVGHFAVVGEEVGQTFGGGLEVQVAYVQFHRNLPKNK